MEKVVKRFSIRKKLIIIFGTLVAVASLVQGVLSIKTARKAVIEKVQIHLTDKASDTVSIIDEKITTFFRFLEGIARIPALYDPAYSYVEKVLLLKKEAQANSKIAELNITTTNGTCYYEGGSVQVSDRKWFQTALSGTNFISEPYLDKANGNLVRTLAVPVYNAEHTIVGVLSADVKGILLSQDIAGIIVGKTGLCYILGLTGTTIADRDITLVETQFNASELAKTDSSLVSLGEFEKIALKAEKPSIGYYTYKGVAKIAAYAKSQLTG